MYAILDIETTGGKFNEEGVTEIAIYRHDGHKITDQFISLVNPERAIQPFVERLTGINSLMLKNAPRFFEIAKRIIEITSDCMVVAHNADFDYRILRTEFKRLGYTFERNSICTVAFSQELIPEMESYKLGNLVRALGIPISDRHRAQGDALATVKLFELLLDKDENKEILKSQIKALHVQKVPSKYLDILELLPNETGVYYMHNEAGKIIYIGKSKNIKHRVRNHLTASNKKALKIQNNLHRVNHELTGSELIALLKEQHEIKKNQPPFNRDGRYRIYPIGIRVDYEKVYHNLELEQIRNDREYVMAFKNGGFAKKVLAASIKAFKLCQNHSSLKVSEKSCNDYKKGDCNGACLAVESANEYNQRIADFVKDKDYPHDDFLMIEKGRKEGEYSFVYIQSQVFKGYGYFELNYQINTLNKLTKRMISIEDNSDCKALVMSFISKKKYRKLIPLNKEEFEK